MKLHLSNISSWYGIIFSYGSKFGIISALEDEKSQVLTDFISLIQ